MSLSHALKHFRLNHKKILPAVIGCVLIGTTVFGLLLLSNTSDKTAQAADPFVVSGMSPNSGPVAGNTTVTINGTGFIDGIKVTQISTGQNHTCALLSTGSVRCWGLNTNGQLGYGDVTQRLSPGGDVAVGGSVIQISTGQNHTCALLSTGSVRCWGVNNFGTLGTGDQNQRTSPVAVLDIANGALISVGGSYTCAVLSTGSVRCWRANGNGQLGYMVTLLKEIALVVTSSIFRQ